MNNIVCHISTVHNAYDDRIFYKECTSISEYGYNIVEIAPKDKIELNNNFKIINFPRYESRFKRFFIGSFLIFIKAKKVKAKLYHFHDPELILIGVLLKIFGKKVIYDVHEDISKQVLYKNWIKIKFIRKITSFLISFIENVCIYFFDAVVVVTEDIMRKFPSKKTILVRNFPILKVAEKYYLQKNESSSIFKFIYCGALTTHRGIKEIIKAFNLIKEQNIELWLLGKWESEDFENECMKLASKKIKYLGFVSMEEAYSYINKSDVGIAILHPLQNYLTSLPVKAFEYMMFEKPIVMSDFPYWKEQFKDCSIFVNPFNIEEITEAFYYMIKNIEKRNILGKNGRLLIEKEYSWESEATKLLILYNKLLKNGNKNN